VVKHIGGNSTERELRLVWTGYKTEKRGGER